MAEWNYTALQNYINSWSTLDAAGSLVADGVTDNSVALQALINNNPKRRILLPAGTIVLSAEIALKTYTALIGHDSGTTVLHANASTESITFRLDSVWKIWLQNITFDGNGIGYTAIIASFIDRVIVQDCTFTNYLRCAWRSNANSEMIALLNNTVQSVSGAEGVVTGFSPSYCRSLVIASNSFSEIGSIPGDWAIYISAEHGKGRYLQDDVVIRNNTVVGCIGGVKVTVQDIGMRAEISSNEITATVQNAIVLGNLAHAEVHHNTCSVPKVCHNLEASCANLHIHDEIISCTNTTGDFDSVLGILLSEPGDTVLLEDCTLSKPQSVLGHGIQMRDNNVSSSLIIRRCTITNFSTAIHQATGSSKLYNATISDCELDSGSTSGTGIKLINADIVLIESNDIRNQQFAFNVEAANAGDISNCIIQLNTIRTYCQNWGRMVNTLNSIVRNNTSHATATMTDGSTADGWNSIAGSINLSLLNNVVEVG